jgi:hypothetical protein
MSCTYELYEITYYTISGIAIRKLANANIKYSQQLSPSSAGRSGEEVAFTKRIAKKSRLGLGADNLFDPIVARKIA